MSIQTKSAESKPLEALRIVISENNWDGMAVRDTANIRWLTGFEKVFDSESAHCLLVTPEVAILHTDSRYSAAAREAAETRTKEGGESSILVDESRNTHAVLVANALSTLGSDEQPNLDAEARSALGTAVPSTLEADRAPLRLAIEDSISLAEYRRFEKALPDAELIETDKLIVGLRAIKSDEELERMRSAQSITDAAFTHIVDWLRARIADCEKQDAQLKGRDMPTEREVQLELDRFMLDSGADGLAFTTIVATGANAANPHAIPGETRLAKGDAVVMDFGAVAHGYASDMTRTVFIGEPDVELARAYEVLRCANETVEARLKSGMTGVEAHELAEKVLADGGFEGCMGHGLGHGVGLEVHEEPCLNTRNDKALPEGAVVTVEPGIYIPGRFGMRLEDCGVITAEGYQPFTRSPHDPVVI